MSPKAKALTFLGIGGAIDYLRSVS